MALSTSIANFRFLDLPRELRDKVYEHAAGDDDFGPDKKDTFLFWRPLSARALSQTSSRIRSEILHVLVKRNAIKFPLHPNRGLRTLWDSYSNCLAPICSDLTWSQKFPDRTYDIVGRYIDRVMDGAVDFSEDVYVHLLSYDKAESTIGVGSLVAARTFLDSLSPKLKYLLRPESQPLMFCAGIHPSLFCWGDWHSNCLLDMFPEWKTICIFVPNTYPGLQDSAHLTIFERMETARGKPEPSDVDVKRGRWISTERKVISDDEKENVLERIPVTIPKERTVDVMVVHVEKRE